MNVLIEREKQIKKAAATRKRKCMSKIKRTKLYAISISIKNVSAIINASKLCRK